MKKLICILMAAVLLLACAPAMAAGKLSVSQENFHFVTGVWNYGYAYAKVENIGDKPIKVNAGVLEIYDGEGEVITSTDYMRSYATYLQPGEYTYVTMYEEVEDAEVVPSDYMLTLTGKSDNSEIAVRLPVETKLELGVTEGWWDYNYMYATITNNTDATLFDLEIVLALLDGEGNILNVESVYLYNEIGVPAGQTLVVRKDISSSFMEYFEANQLTPAQVDAIAYVLVDNE